MLTNNGKYPVFIVLDIINIISRLSPFFFETVLLYIVQAGLFVIVFPPSSLSAGITHVSLHLACYFIFKVYFIIFNYVYDSHLQS